MKQVVVILACLGVIGVLLAVEYLYPKEVQTAQQVVQTQTVEFVPTTRPASPVRVNIPALHITAEVELVGLDEKGNMDVPKQDENVGWYTLGYKPGEQGSVVIAGHFDTKTGTPAVFYSLHTVNQGDKVEIIDENSHTSTYIVENVTSYPYDELPLQELFASTEPLLRIITCKGSFNTETENYSDRLVVTARLQSFK